MKAMYKALRGDQQKMTWRKVFYNNSVRPKAIFILQLVCQDILATRTRLHKMGMVDDTQYSLCDKEETTRLLFFECDHHKEIWTNILKWIQIVHTPEDWHFERTWMEQNRIGRRKKAAMIKPTVTETIYEIWKYINEKNWKSCE